MEQIKITVVSTTLSTPLVLMSSAVVLSDLKRELNLQGIETDDMSFKEGVTKTALVSDSTELPRYKADGTVIPELVVMMTGATKKIKSGATKRSELLTTIKNMIAANPILKVTFGNYTIRTSAELEKIVAANMPHVKNTTKVAPLSTNTPKEVAVELPTTVSSDFIKREEAIAILENALMVLKGTASIIAPIEITENHTIEKAVELPKKPVLTSGFSEEELEEMVSELEY